MPIHDWTGNDHGFQNFQLGWVVDLARVLNHGVLPSDHFALNETLDLRPGVRFCALSEPSKRLSGRVDPGKSLELDDSGPIPPAELFDPRRQFACRAISIRHADHYQPVAAILWVTGQDKAVPYRLRGLLEVAVSALTHSVHLMVIDPFPPTPRVPHGFHQLLMEDLGESVADAPANKPLAVASYRGGSAVDSYVEPLAVGDPLPEMPLFLAPGMYVPCPLEETYQSTWAALPAMILEGR